MLKIITCLPFSVHVCVCPYVCACMFMYTHTFYMPRCSISWIVIYHEYFSRFLILFHLVVFLYSVILLSIIYLASPLFWALSFFSASHIYTFATYLYKTYWWSSWTCIPGIRDDTVGNISPCFLQKLSVARRIWAGSLNSMTRRS